MAQGLPTATVRETFPREPRYACSNAGMKNDEFSSIRRLDCGRRICFDGIQIHIYLADSPLLQAIKLGISTPPSTYRIRSDGPGWLLYLLNLMLLSLYPSITRQNPLCCQPQNSGRASNVVVATPMTSQIMLLPARSSLATGSGFDEG